MKHISIFAITLSLTIFAAFEAAPKVRMAGKYVCEVKVENIISEIHLENAGPLQGYANNKPNYSFAISIADIGKDKFAIQEIRGKSFNVRHLTLENGEFPSVLVEKYTGNGQLFKSKNGSGSFQLYSVPKSKDTKFTFWHSGFEFPGGEDTNFVSRYGVCTSTSTSTRDN